MLFQLNFFKLFGVMVCLVAVAGTGAAQSLQCNAFSGVPPIVRGGGQAELVSDVVIVCTGGTPTAANAAVPQVDIQVFLNTNLTSRLLSDPWSEALLLVDEPGGPVPSAAPQRVCGTAGDVETTPGVCVVTGTGDGQGVYNGTPGRPNVFQGRLASGNSILWEKIPVDPPGALAPRLLRIVNLRANASQLPVSAPGFPPSQVSATVVASVLGSPQVIVAFVSQGLSFNVAQTGAFEQCVSQNPALAADPSANGVAQLRLRFDEVFPTALKKRTNAPFVDANTSPPPAAQNVPGLFYFSETGFFAPAFPDIPGRGMLARAGLADHGVRLMARFTGIPAGVSLFAAAALPTIRANGSSVGGVLRLIDFPPPGAPVPPPLPPLFPPQPPATPFLPAPASAFGISPIPVAGGTALAVYEVLEAAPFEIERVEIPIYVAYTANGASPGLGTAQVTGSLVPITLGSTASPDMPLPRFADTQPAPLSAFTVASCGATFASTKAMIQQFTATGQIDNHGISNSLLQHLAAAEKATQPVAARNVLEAMSNFVRAQQGKHIQTSAASQLLAAIASLIAAL